MIYNLEWKEHALHNLEKLENSISRRIIKKVEELADNPFSKDIKKLKARNEFRLRVGDYRVFFSIEQNTIQILKVGHRKNIYKY